MFNIKHWTKFEGQPRPSSHRAEGFHVTLNRYGAFYLNKQAYEAIGQPKYIEFLFDEIRRVIGVHPADEWQTNAFPIYKRKNAAGVNIHASPFCNHHMIWTRRTLRFNAVEVDEEGVLSLPIASLTGASRSINAGKPFRKK